MAARRPRPTPHRLMLLAEAAAILLFMRLAVRVVPLAELTGGRVERPDDTPHGPDPLIDPSRRARIGDVAWAIGAVVRHIPIRFVCLPQALAARLMLRRRGIASVLHVGAKPGTGRPWDLHVWLDAAGIAVTGHREARVMTEVCRLI